MATTTRSFNLPHGRSVRIEESVESGFTTLVLQAPGDTPKIFIRMMSWKSEHARKRGNVRESLGMELNREGMEALHTMLGELLDGAESPEEE